MHESNLDRIQQDLTTIRNITGDELPFDPWDMRLTLLNGGLLLVPAVLALCGVQSRSWLLAASVPAVVVTLFTVARNWIATHPDKSCSHRKRKEYRAGTPVMLVIVAALAGFRYWVFAAGGSAAVANGSVMFFLGLLVLIDGLYTRDRRSSLLPGVAGIVAGLAWPFCTPFQLFALACGGVGLALVGASLMMYRQLSMKESLDVVAN